MVYYVGSHQAISIVAVNKSIIYPTNESLALMNSRVGLLPDNVDC